MTSTPPTGSGPWDPAQPPPPPPPPGQGYPGTGYQGPTGGDRLVYEYGAPPPGRLPRANYGSRALAFLVDSVVVLALPVAAIVTMQVGPSEVQTCDITEDGNLALFEDGVTTGLCEVPTTGTFAVAGLLGAFGVLVWFAYVAWEGRSSQTLGKRLLRIRTVDARTGEPIGAGRNVGRNLIRGLMTTLCFLPFVLDHLWPLWDRDGQTLHDKATSAAVVPVEQP